MSPVVVAPGVTYELPNGRRLFENLTFSLSSRVTGLVGPNGAGKTCLARELMLLDEPTNNLDIYNVEFLERIVSGFQGAVVVVPHDARFFQHCGIDQELVLQPFQSGSPEI